MLFKGEYFFLSTFYPCEVVVEINDKKLLFGNVEAAFQAQKNPAVASKFSLLKGLEAKKLGEALPSTEENWQVLQLFAMAKALHSKFSDFDLRTKLCMIRDPIINENFWGDEFWGVCKGKGKNILGKLLMKIRDTNNDFTKLSLYISLELIKDVQQ